MGAVETVDVGLIVVHGIGEQQPGDHLEGVVKPLVEALNTEQRRVEVRPLAAATGEAKRAEILIREVTGGVPGARLVRIGVHEVHWADINEPASIGKGIRFWLWGLSAWWPLERRVAGSEEFKKRMTLPCFGPGQTAHLDGSGRVQLFIVGWLFLLAAPLIVLADYLAKKLFGTKLPASLTTLVNYVSAVKLYSQARRHGAGKLASAAEQPRFTIRRRMVEAIAEVAGSGYDRWYVFAHSQGTVVAFNGLMTDGSIMANYLNDERLDRLGPGIVRPLDPSEALEMAADGKLMPAVPPQRLHAPRSIDRRALFAGFRGLLTYGSPLDKFAGIWPPTVAMARREPAVFSPDARWINVWDPTDPVSAQLDAFEPACVLGAGADHTGCLRPENHAVAAGPVLLASHLGYLAEGTGSAKPLTVLLGDWLLHGTRPDLGPLTIRRVGLRRAWAATQVAVVLVALLCGWTFISAFVPQLARALPVSFLGKLGLASAVSLGLVFVLGLIGRLSTELDPADRRIGPDRQRVFVLNWLEALVKGKRR